MLYDIADKLVTYTLAIIILLVMLSALFGLLSKLIFEIRWNLQAKRLNEQRQQSPSCSVHKK